MSTNRGIRIERQVLLVEFERRCSAIDCGGRVLVALTKSEACEYEGFRCTHCDSWNPDNLIQKDVPDWWSDIHKKGDDRIESDTNASSSLE